MHAHLRIASSIKESDIEEQLKTQSVDIQHIQTDVFTITDARMLVSAAFLRPVERDDRIFVVCFQSITIEAQNALLKLLEEPPQNVVFYILIPHDSLLIPTLRSRLLDTGTKEDIHSIGIATDFLKFSYAERLELIAKKVKEKDLQWMQVLLQELNTCLHDSQSKINASALPALMFAESYILIRGASRKMLLEDLALSLPQITNLEVKPPN